MRRFLISCLIPLALTIGGSSEAETETEVPRGKVLFESATDGNCVPCHYTTGLRKVGPGLLDVTKRHSREWLVAWLTDPQGTWRSEHPETLELRQRTRKLRSRATSCIKRPMEEEKLQDLVDYLETLVSEEPRKPTE